MKELKIPELIISLNISGKTMEAYAKFIDEVQGFPGPQPHIQQQGDMDDDSDDVDALVCII